MQKSKKNALLISALTLLSFTLSAAVIDFLPGLVQGQPLVSQDANLPAIAGLLVFLFLAGTGLFAFFLYSYFGEAYFGRRGVLRWALFGCIFGALIGLPALFNAPEIVCLPLLWGLVSMLPAFFAARWIIPKEHK